MAFQRIGELEGEKVMVKWISNEADEALESYAVKLIETYNIQKGEMIVGLSFGGILAQEIGRILGSHSVILISSFRSRNDMRLLFKIGVSLGLNKFIPTTKIPVIEYLVAHYLNSGNKTNSKVLKKMFRQTDYTLLVWSTEKITELKKDNYQHLTRHNIKGTRDRIIRDWTNENTYIIEGGSHFMVYDQAEKVTQIISNILKVEA